MYAHLTELIISSGLFVIAGTIFLECGFIGGFFLPGDTLLFLAGFIAGKGTHNIVLTIAVVFVAAVVGNVVGYHVGRKTGPRIFSKEDGVLFRKEHILQSQQFYAKHGGKTLILARFVPVMRTFAPLVAGIGSMPFRPFFIYSTVGAALWATLITSLGFWAYRVLGHSINIDKYILPIVVVVMVVSIGGSAIHALRESMKHRGKTALATKDLEAGQSEADKLID